MDHPDSPYIRGIGFLFVRYLVSPEKLMDWFAPYFEDTTEIKVWLSQELIFLQAIGEEASKIVGVDAARSDRMNSIMYNYEVFRCAQDACRIVFVEMFVTYGFLHYFL